MINCDKYRIQHKDLSHGGKNFTSPLPSNKFGIQECFPHVRSLSGELLAVQLVKYTSSSFAHFFSHTQKSSSVPSSSQSTASSACSPSACNLSNPVSASRKPVSLNALNIIAKPCVSYAFRTCSKTRTSVSLAQSPRVETPTHRLAASSAAVVSSADYCHGAELREKPTQLMRHEPQHAAALLLLL